MKIWSARRILQKPNSYISHWTRQSHQHLLLFYRMLATMLKSNTMAGRLRAARRRVKFRPVDEQAIEKK